MRVRRGLWAGLVLAAGTVGSDAQWMPAHNTDAGVKPAGEFIYAPGTVTPECHASTIVSLKNGDLLAAWFGGAHERAPDVAIYTARMHDGAWSKPVEVARETEDGKGVPTWNPVLFHTRDGRLWLYYKYGASPSVWKAKRMWSADEGVTWSAKEMLRDGILGPIRAKPLVLDDGVIVSGSSVEGSGGWRAYIERSTDDGRTWARIGPRSRLGRC